VSPFQQSLKIVLRLQVDIPPHLALRDPGKAPRNEWIAIWFERMPTSKVVMPWSCFGPVDVNTVTEMICVYISAGIVLDIIHNVVEHER
jgi:hypothetical protein